MYGVIPSYPMIVPAGICETHAFSSDTFSQRQESVRQDIRRRQITESTIYTDRNTAETYVSYENTDRNTTCLLKLVLPELLDLAERQIRSRAKLLSQERPAPSPRRRRPPTPSPPWPPVLHHADATTTVITTTPYRFLAAAILLKLTQLSSASLG